MAAIKFRPSLTLEEIQFLIGNVRWTDNPEQLPLLRKLEVFTLKAKHGITQASHVSVGKQSIESSLGFTADETIESLLTIYRQNPKLLSPAQLARVQYHRYTNDMMTPAEEASYEGDMS